MRPMERCVPAPFSSAYSIFLFYLVFLVFGAISAKSETDKRARAFVGGCPAQQCRDWRKGYCARRVGQLEESD